MSIRQTIVAFRGVEGEPSTIIGHQDPEVNAVLISGGFVEKLGALGIHARVVKEREATEQKRESYANPASEEIPTIMFPEGTRFGFRNLGNVALEVTPPIDEQTLPKFQEALATAFQPPKLVMDTGPRITTEEIEQIVQGTAPSVLDSNPTATMAPMQFGLD